MYTHVLIYDRAKFVYNFFLHSNRAGENLSVLYTMYAHTVRACVYYTNVCKPIMALKREHLMEINFIMQVFKLFSHLCIKKIFSYNFSLIFLFLYNKNVK